MKKQVILIVEDSPTQQAIIESMVRNFGFATKTAATGRQALEAAKSGPYAAILMDIGLPDIDGFECSWQIRQSEIVTGWRVPIIAVTSSEFDNNFQMRYRQCGIDDYLRKPFLPEALQSHILRYTGTPHYISA